MATFVTLNESNASRRCVPIWCVASNGTSAATFESGRTFYFSLGGVDYGSGGSLSVVSSDLGLYSCNFSASKVSVVGQGQVYYSSNTALPTSTPFMVVPFDSFDSMRLGLFALPNAAAGASGALPIKGTTNSDFTVRIEGVDYSGLTIKGITNYANISNVTLAAGTHSSVTIQGITNPDPIADAFLARNVAGGSSTGRLVKEAFYVLRNKVAVEGSAMTVFQTNDTSSAWTAVITTGTNPISTVDPVA